MGDLYGISGFLALFVGRIQSVMHEIVVQFDHISIGKDLYCLEDDLLCTQPTVWKLHLDQCLVVHVVNLEGGSLGSGGSSGFESCGHVDVWGQVDSQIIKNYLAYLN